MRPDGTPSVQAHGENCTCTGFVRRIAYGVSYLTFLCAALNFLLMSKQASTIQNAHAGMRFLELEIDLGVVGLCLEGDGVETGNINIAFGESGHKVCLRGLGPWAGGISGGTVLPQWQNFLRAFGACEYHLLEHYLRDNFSPRLRRKRVSPPRMLPKK